MEYVVIKNITLGSLTVSVQNRMAEGWIPIGGLAIIPRTKLEDQTKTVYHQAMIRETPLPLNS
jgi:hypothetical protein